MLITVQGRFWQKLHYIIIKTIIIVYLTACAVTTKKPLQLSLSLFPFLEIQREREKYLRVCFQKSINSFMFSLSSLRSCFIEK